MIDYTPVVETLCVSHVNTFRDYFLSCNFWAFGSKADFMSSGFGLFGLLLLTFVINF